MCKISEKNIHWCLRYSSGRTRPAGRTRTAGWPDGRMAGRPDGRSPNYYPPQNFFFLVGDNIKLEIVRYISLLSTCFCACAMTRQRNKHTIYIKGLKVLSYDPKFLSVLLYLK